jgi:hypothetical protein
MITLFDWLAYPFEPVEGSCKTRLSYFKPGKRLILFTGKQANPLQADRCKTGSPDGLLMHFYDRFLQNFCISTNNQPKPTLT